MLLTLIVKPIGNIVSCCQVYAVLSLNLGMQRRGPHVFLIHQWVKLVCHVESLLDSYIKLKPRTASLKLAWVTQSIRSTIVILIFVLAQWSILFMDLRIELNTSPLLGLG